MCTTKEAYFRESKISLRNKEVLLNYESVMQSGYDYRDWPVIKSTNEDWGIEMMEWGFIPIYVRTREEVNKFRRGYTDERGKFHIPLTTLNAKGEELLLPNKMFRNATLERRCLFVLTGFYEWRHVPQIGKKGQVLKATSKYPYHLKVKGEPYFFIAGIYQPFKDFNTGEIKETAASVTTAANSLMEQVHNSKKRQPTILPKELAEEWISDGLTEQRITEIATYQLPSDQLDAYTINRDYKKAEDPREPVAYPELPALQL